LVEPRRWVGSGEEAGWGASTSSRPSERRPVGVLPGSGSPPEVITVAVRWYLRYSLSYRDVEELLAERGVEVDHVTVYRWVQRFTPLFADAARPCRHATGDRWFVDETGSVASGVPGAASGPEKRRSHGQCEIVERSCEAELR
jgi:hypothetical protein